MSITRCDYCDTNIDFDFDSEHFDSEKGYRCIVKEQDNEVDLFDLDKLEKELELNLEELER